MRINLKARLSLNIALVALLTVGMIGIAANAFIKRQFEAYVEKRNQQRIESILSEIRQRYNPAIHSWDTEFLHSIGMYALYDGYIIKIADAQLGTLWDAEKHDMSACAKVMDDMSQKMSARFPDSSGKFIVKNHDLLRNGEVIGVASIGYFSPYFYNDDDFNFLEALNLILVGSGIVSFLLAIALGWFLAKRLSDPIKKTADFAQRMSDGDYTAKSEAKTGVAELDALACSVNQLAHSLNRQERLRKQLTADVAHELRTPLTNVATHIEAMLDGVWEATPERLSGCFDEIGRIGKLVSDLENLAKVESETLKLDKTRIDLAALAKKALESFETDIAEKQLDIRVEGHCPEIMADRRRIDQVLLNLFSNAVKYVSTGGHIRVVVSETAHFAHLSVLDNGIGISEADQPHVFERFYRADKSRGRLSGGSGIGLAIVRSIVMAHGGSVEVKSRLHEGSRFEITLPKSDDINA